MQQEHLDLCKEKMEKSLESFKNLLSHVRTGQANVSILDPVNVDYYGSPTPLNQIAGISVVEGKQLLIKPFDPTSLKGIERAIHEANLNLNPLNDGSVIRINVPQMTEEVRKNTVKEIQKNLEEAKVSLRNIRRDINEAIKKAEDLTEDIEKDTLEKVQKITDEYIKKLEDAEKAKADEIMKI